MTIEDCPPLEMFSTFVDTTNDTNSRLLTAAPPKDTLSSMGAPVYPELRPDKIGSSAVLKFWQIMKSPAAS